MRAATVLREARRRAGLTQAELAAASGLKQPTISRIERGAVDPSIQTLEMLLSACGESLESTPKLGIGIDRTLFQQTLELSPADRLRMATHDSQALTRFLQSTSR